MNKKFDLSLKLSLSEKGFIQFAQVGRPHGLSGAFFLKTEDKRTKWDGYKTLLLETQDGFYETKVNRSYVSGNALVLEVDAIASREELEKLYHKNIYVHKSEIKVQKDEYIVASLKGYSVVIENKGIIGTVVGVNSFGAQDNLEIQIPNSKETLFYPFIEPFIIKVDSEKKQIDIQYVAEFFEDAGL